MDKKDNKQIDKKDEKILNNVIFRDQYSAFFSN